MLHQFYIEKNNYVSSKQCRKSFLPKLMIGFKPYGVPRSMIEEVILQYDEYEVIRVLDYEGILQEQAAENEYLALLLPVFMKMHAKR